MYACALARVGHCFERGRAVRGGGTAGHAVLPGPAPAKLANDLLRRRHAGAAYTNCAIALAAGSDTPVNRRIRWACQRHSSFASSEASTPPSETNSEAPEPPHGPGFRLSRGMVDHLLAGDPRIDVGEAPEAPPVDVDRLREAQDRKSTRMNS